MGPADAAALFIALEAEGLIQSERELLDLWLAEDPTNVREFERAKSAWTCFTEAGDSELLTAMRQHALSQQESPWRGWQRLSSVAATIALFVVGTVLLLPRLGEAPIDRGTAAAVHYASAKGQVREIRLSDGSVMTLDSDSQAIGELDSERRTVRLLKGRSFFAVAPDADRPFEVLARGQRVVAIGTRFDVSMLADG